MGFFDFLFGSSEESTLKKHAKRVNNLNAQFEERQASAQWLAENASPEAITALLNRFSISYEHNMKDAEEKDQIIAHLHRLGHAATPTIRDWIKNNDKFARPLSIIETFDGEEEVIGLLIELLSLEDDPFKPEKKRQILIHLAKSKDPRIAEAAIPELANFDEGIRYAAVEALGNQEEEAARVALESALANKEEESNRYRVRIAELFLSNNWALESHIEEISTNLPVGFSLVENRFFKE